MELINLTGHTIKLFTGSREIVFEAVRPKARVSYEYIFDDEIYEQTLIPVYRIIYVIEGLPEPREDKLYIVSSLVFNGTNRTDLLLPYEIQKHNGKPYGCRKLLRKEI